MILFLDDSPTRTRRFRSACPSAFCESTASAMIKRLLAADEPIERLFLDHDLGGEVGVSSDRVDCGMEVVRWLKANPRPITRIVIHSSNFSASMLMQEQLEQAGYDVAQASFTRFDELVELI